MNQINFKQTGGFPLETETLDALQKAYSIFNALAKLQEKRAIVKGCEKTGITISDGYIYFDGELLAFKGGQEQSKIIIKENSTKVEFEDKTEKPVYYERYACFGMGTKTVKWSEFKRLDTILFLME